MQCHPNRKGRSGFTLIEIMGSIVIIGLLAGTIFTTYRLASRAVVSSQAKTESRAVMQWVVEHLKSKPFSELYALYSTGTVPDLYSLVGEDPPPGFEYSVKLEPVDGVPVDRLLQVTVTLLREGKEEHAVSFYLTRGGF